MPLPFGIPVLQDNPDGWGPSSVPEHLKDVPFAPYGKGDRLGRASDWTQTAYSKYPGRGPYQSGGGVGNAVFSFFANEEEESFHLVDNRPVKANKFGGRGGRFSAASRLQQQRAVREAGAKGQPEEKKGGKMSLQAQRKQPWQNYGRENQRDVVTCGELESYEKSYDRVTVKSETSLEKTKRAFRNVTTSDDPVIRRLAGANEARVFATDALLTTLMCVKSSVYSWDLLATRVGDKLFFDKREASSLHLLTVNETAPDPVAEDKDSMNGVQQLSLEATAINQNFSQQVLVKGGERVKFDEPNPFSSGDSQEELASCAYKYRRWRLREDEESPVDIVVRCELDGVMQHKGETQLLSIKALNEHDARAQDWRKKIESQRGAVLAFETKNNKNKVAKWTAAALLAGADMIKLGYVSRIGPRDNFNHILLGTQVCKPKDFATQINLGMDHCWGIVRALVDMLLKMDEGKYLMVKDPNKELLRIYAIPDDAFEARYADDANQANDERIGASMTSLGAVKL
ncbi:MAG: hypothetical protein WDW38_008797 [Sanguina aurantia]